MKDYEKLINNRELNEIIDNVNIMQKDNLFACHGRYHTMFVVEKVEKLLKELGMDERTIELGKIVSLLHDIGAIEGKKGHPYRSSEMCKKYLAELNLTASEENMIIEAIADHSKGENITSVIGAALLIVDKISLDKERVLELGKKDENYLLLTINKADVRYQDGLLTIEFLVNEKFTKNKFESEWAKGISVINKACNYLNCEHEFLFIEE